MKNMKDIDMIQIENLENLDMLKEFCIYSDDFAELSKIKQNEIYAYCKCNANNPVCRENLKQIRYAVTRLYFGW